MNKLIKKLAKKNNIHLTTKVTKNVKGRKITYRKPKSEHLLKKQIDNKIKKSYKYKFGMLPTPSSLPPTNSASTVLLNTELLQEIFKKGLTTKDMNNLGLVSTGLRESSKTIADRYKQASNLPEIHKRNKKSRIEFYEHLLNIYSNEEKIDLHKTVEKIITKMSKGILIEDILFNVNVDIYENILNILSNPHFRYQIEPNRLTTLYQHFYSIFYKNLNKDIHIKINNYIMKNNSHVISFLGQYIRDEIYTHANLRKFLLKFTNIELLNFITSA
jgi:hypothetical protein